MYYTKVQNVLFMNIFKVIYVSPYNIVQIYFVSIFFN